MERARYHSRLRNGLICATFNVLISHHFSPEPEHNIIIDRVFIVTLFFNIKILVGCLAMDRGAKNILYKISHFKQQQNGALENILSSQFE